MVLLSENHICILTFNADDRNRIVLIVTMIFSSLRNVFPAYRLLPFAVTAAVVFCLSFSPAGAATILVLGDSLSSAYGMEVDQGWVRLLDRRLNSGKDGRYRVVNLSMAGETTRGGRTRLPQALRQHAPDLVILELGGNDGLRGFPIPEIERNLEAMIVESKAADSDVLLLGMRLPPNYGPRYTRAFADIYKALASRHQVLLVPFFLEGVATDTAFMRPDRIHPRANAQQRLLDNVWLILGGWIAARLSADRQGFCADCRIK